MDAIELLTQQHRETEDLFERFEQTSDPEQQQDIATTAIKELRLHTAIEEEIFYPAVRDQGGELAQDVLEDLEEHHAVETLLDELEGMEPSQERFAAKFRVVSEMVLHHVQEEEQEQFPHIREQFDDQRLQDLGDQMQQRYEELKTDGEVDGASKEELYQKAAELKIEGRSQMSKRELVDAVKSNS